MGKTLGSPPEMDEAKKKKRIILALVGFSLTPNELGTKGKERAEPW